MVPGSIPGVSSINLCKKEVKITMSLDSQKSLVIAIDFDSTFTADPELFKAFIGLMKARGHRPIMVTARPEEHGMDEAPKAAVGHLMPIIFSAGDWKANAAEEAGYEVDIWIDDLPQFCKPPLSMREMIENFRKNNHLIAITRGQ